MKQYILKNTTLALLGISLVLAGCHKDLDRFPLNDLTSERVYSSLQGYTQVLAKVYAAFATTGSFGPGSSDLRGIDPGTSDFLRLWWQAQTVTTDEAVIGWNDADLRDLPFNVWTSSNTFMQGLYVRCLYQITVANEFLRESTNDRLASRGITGADAEAVRAMRNEVRFLRAFQYWVLMDVFGNPPFLTEENLIGSVLPQQIKRNDLFNYVENELKEIEPQMAAPRSLPYGRADRAAVWALQSRLYLNAHIYNGGTTRYPDCIAACQKVIGAGYELAPNYRHLFLADNHLNTNENIFTINYDGARTQNFGGTTYLVHAAVGGNMQASQFGINSGWGGLRATRRLPEAFPDPSGSTDQRAMFFQQKLDIDNIGEFTDGWAVTKWKNIKRDGTPGTGDPTGTFVDTDFPLFRLGEIYLNYAEATLRAGASTTQALEYINLLRRRAFANPSEGNIASINLELVFAERSRELYWEGLRRTDLIRFGRFTGGTYNWPFKGGVANGTAIPDYRALFPIPANDVVANPNLVQNPNY